MELKRNLEWPEGNFITNNAYSRMKKFTIKVKIEIIILYFVLFIKTALSVILR